jgi:EpsI family protein
MKPPDLDRLPVQLGPWRAVDLGTDEGTEQLLAADKTIRRCYVRDDGSRVWMWIAYYTEQHVNAQIHSPRNCVPGGGWLVASIEDRPIDFGGGTRSVKRMIVRKDGFTQEILYWFETHSGAASDEYALKWDLVKSALARRPTNAAMIRFNAPQEDSTAVRQLISLVAPPLAEILLEVGLQ